MDNNHTKNNQIIIFNTLFYMQRPWCKYKLLCSKQLNIINSYLFFNLTFHSFSLDEIFRSYGQPALETKIKMVENIISWWKIPFIALSFVSSIKISTFFNFFYSLLLHVQTVLRPICLTSVFSHNRHSFFFLLLTLVSISTRNKIPTAVV